jgi:hypothetical protein
MIANLRRPSKCPLLALSGHLCLHCTCLLLTQSGHPAGGDHSGLGSGKERPIGERFARLAINRRGLRLRWTEAVRCGVALSIDVDGLCL